MAVINDKIKTVLYIVGIILIVSNIGAFTGLGIFGSSNSEFRETINSLKSVNNRLKELDDNNKESIDSLKETNSELKQEIANSRARESKLKQTNKELQKQLTAAGKSNIRVAKALSEAREISSGAESTIGIFGEQCEEAIRRIEEYERNYK